MSVVEAPPHSAVESLLFHVHHFLKLYSKASQVTYGRRWLLLIPLANFYPATYTSKKLPVGTSVNVVLLYVLAANHFQPPSLQPTLAAPCWPRDKMPFFLHLNREP